MESSSSVDNKGKGKEVVSEERAIIDRIREFVHDEVAKAEVEGFENLADTIISLAETTFLLLEKLNDEEFEVVKGIVKRLVRLKGFLNSPVYMVSLPRAIDVADGGFGSFGGEPEDMDMLGISLIPGPWEVKFRHFRQKSQLSEAAFFASIKTSESWDPQGGKSKCMFGMTADKKFIIKEIHPIEYQSLMDFAERYVDHMLSPEKSCLAKIFGVYKLHGKPVIVMENLSYEQEDSSKYDIKGVKNPARVGTDGVLLDNNLICHMKIPLFLVDSHSKSMLLEAVNRDTKFLQMEHVMDYSLLLVVNDKTNTITCGIIDYLRPYTNDKKLENFFKSIPLPRDVTPTVIPPIDYAARLRGFLETHLLTPSDHPPGLESFFPGD